MSHYPPRAGGGPDRRGRGPPPREYSRGAAVPIDTYYPPPQGSDSYRPLTPPRPTHMSERDRYHAGPPSTSRDRDRERDYRDAPRGYAQYDRDPYFPPPPSRERDRGRDWRPAGPGPNSAYDVRWDEYSTRGYYSRDRDGGAPYERPRGGEYPPYDDRYPPDRSGDNYRRGVYDRPQTPPPPSHYGHRDSPPPPRRSGPPPPRDKERDRDVGMTWRGAERRPRSRSHSERGGADHVSETRSSPRRRGALSRSRSRSPVPSPARSPQNAHGTGPGRWRASGIVTPLPPRPSTLTAQNDATDSRQVSHPLPASVDIPRSTEAAVKMEIDEPSSTLLAPPPSGPPPLSSSRPKSPPPPPRAKAPIISPTQPRNFQPTPPTGPAPRHSLPSHPHLRQQGSLPTGHTAPSQKDKDGRSWPPPTGPKAAQQHHNQSKKVVVEAPKEQEVENLLKDPLDPANIPPKIRVPSATEEKIAKQMARLRELDEKLLAQKAIVAKARFDLLCANLDKEHATFRVHVAQRQRLHLEKGLPMEAYDELEQEGAFGPVATNTSATHVTSAGYGIGA